LVENLLPAGATTTGSDYESSLFGEVPCNDDYRASQRDTLALVS
jgi:hypothetical protein